MSLEEFFGVLLIAASPVVELRGAIPLAIYTYDFPWYSAFAISVIGNLLPVPLLLVLWDKLSRLLSKIGVCERILRWVYARTRRQGRLIKKYERVGLMLFVAVPLPFTGAWTGSIAAFLFGIEFRKALLSIVSGVIIAGAIVTCLSLLGWVGALLAGIGLITLAILGQWKI